MALIGEMQYLKIGGNTYSIPSSQDKSTATNWVNGSANSSVRTVGSTAENSNYTMGTYAVAEGASTVASGTGAHAEGLSTTSSNYGSHAEGVSTTASGLYSHAEGYQTTARGEAAHAEGAATKAYSKYSHAEGMNTEAYGRSQHVFGENNIVDSAQSSTNRATYVEIVGNGTDSSNLHNARTLDWSGNEVLAGKLTVGTVGVNSMDVATIGQLPTTTSQLTNDSGYITSYTETDPVFSASAAYSITSSDISNWNDIVSDDHKWNDVQLVKGASYNNNGDIYIPYMDAYNSTTAYTGKGSATPHQGYIAKYDMNAYLYSTTPSANDNSTKVATTAYVDSAVGGISIPTKTSDLTNDSGYITSETDPVFSASAAAGITATDISNWNAKVSDTGKWGAVELVQDTQKRDSYYIPTLTNFNSTSAKVTYATSNPSARAIVLWDINEYLYSTTPSANDNSTKVATTAYVDSAIISYTAGTGIDITNGVISVNLDSAEGGTY